MGVIFMITIPVLNSTKPDKDKAMYQKALYNVQGAMKLAMDDSMIRYAKEAWADEDVSESGFCEAFAEALNTTGKVICNSVSSYDSPNIISTDGIRYWGLEGKNFTMDTDSNEKVKTIYVERDLTAKEKRVLEKKEIHIIKHQD